MNRPAASRRDGRCGCASTSARRTCACACAVLAACSTVDGDRIAALDDARAGTLLVPGHTTEADARAAFGQGSVVQFRSGWSTWHYEYRAGLAKGWDEVPFIGLITSRSARPTKELVLLFDAAGTLRRYALQEEAPPPRHATATPAIDHALLPPPAASAPVVQATPASAPVTPAAMP